MRRLSVSQLRQTKPEGPPFRTTGPTAAMQMDAVLRCRWRSKTGITCVVPPAMSYGCSSRFSKDSRTSRPELIVPTELVGNRVWS
jgi:hypothetical protein